MSMMRAWPCAESVITPACEPVNDRASKPWLAIAIASSAIEIRSPAVSSMSSSRGGGSGDDLLGEVDQVVGGVAHRRDDHDHVIAGAAGVDDPLGDALDPLGVADRRAAVLLHDEGHAASLRTHRLCRRHRAFKRTPGRRGASDVEQPATLEGPTERDLVGVLEVTTDRQPGSQPGDPDVRSA